MPKRGSKPAWGGRAKALKKVLAVIYILVMLRALFTFDFGVLLIVIAVVLAVNFLLGYVGLGIPLRKPAKEPVKE